VSTTSFETSVVILCPLAEVFAYTTNLDNNNRWQKILVEAGITSGNGMGVGTTYRYTVSFMGKRIETEAVVTAFETNRIFSARSLKGPISGEFHLAYEAVTAGTALTTRCNAELGFFRFSKPLALHLAKDLYRRDLDMLKIILEN
jgi:uncharacterized membrane protein